MCFPMSSPSPAAAAAAAPPPPVAPPPADMRVAKLKIGDEGKSGSRSQYNKKKRGTAALRIDSQVGGTAAAGTNIPKK